MEPKTIIIFSVASLVVLVSGIGGYIYMDQMIPPKIIRMNAMMAGDNGSFIIVSYYLDKPLREDISPEYLKVINPKTGEKLGVRNVPKLGMLASHSAGRTSGYFVIDNGFHLATRKSPVTVQIGDTMFENYTLISENGDRTPEQAALPTITLAGPSPQHIGGEEGLQPLPF